MFLDASAVVAILGREESAPILLDKIQAVGPPTYYSPMVVFEAVIALARQRKTAAYGEHAPTPAYLIEEEQSIVDDFFVQIGAIEIPLETGAHKTALEAAKVYGRFVGHPAALNFGDCFSYASAKTLGSQLLFVGNDFSRTDIEIA